MGFKKWHKAVLEVFPENARHHYEMDKLKLEPYWLRLLKTTGWLSLFTLLILGANTLHIALAWVVGIGCFFVLFWHVWHTYLFAKRNAFYARMDERCDEMSEELYRKRWF